MSNTNVGASGVLADESLARGLESDLAKRILAAVSSLKYGSVEVTVHDGRVVQIDRRERVRIDPARK